jgi:hypothetical protein
MAMPRAHALLACATSLMLPIGAALASDAGAMDAYLTADGQLRHELILRDAQSGFAGTTAETRTIGPDGHWRVVRDLNGRPTGPERTGVLNSDQLERLATTLAEQHLLDLPAENGKPSPVNPHSLELRFGDTVSVWHLMPGQTPSEGASAALPTSPTARIAAISRTIKIALGD